MNKLLILLASLILICTVSLKVYAANNNGSSTQGSSDAQNPDKTTGINQGSQGIQGNQAGSTQPIQNQNQVKTQNQGDEQQLRIKVQEQQGTETGKDTNSNSQGAKKNLTETRSSVAQQIKELLETQSAAGGIGEQVKEWARVQSQSQNKIQEHLGKIEGKTGVSRALFGPSYGSLNELKKEMEQNRVRVQQLEQLKLKLTNQGDVENVQEMITLMLEENIALQEKIDAEESDGGLLGWLVKLFAK